MWWQMPVTWVDNPIIATISDSAECLLMRLHTAVAETEEPALSPRMVVAAAGARWSDRKTKALLAELELRGAIAREGNRVVLIDIFGVGQSLDKVGKRRPIDAARKRKGPESLGLLPEFHADSVLQSGERDQDREGDAIRGQKAAASKAEPTAPLPDDWSPSDDCIARIVAGSEQAKGCTAAFAAACVDRFVDYFTTKGKGGGERRTPEKWQNRFKLWVWDNWKGREGDDYRRANGIAAKAQPIKLEM